MIISQYWSLLFFWLFAKVYSESQNSQSQNKDSIYNECPDLDFSYIYKNVNRPVVDISVTNAVYTGDDTYDVTISVQVADGMSKASLSELKFTNDLNRIIFTRNSPYTDLLGDDDPSNFEQTFSVQLTPTDGVVCMSDNFQIYYNWCSTGVADKSECNSWTYETAYQYYTGCDNHNNYDQSETFSPSYCWPAYYKGQSSSSSSSSKTSSSTTTSKTSSSVALDDISLS